MAWGSQEPFSRRLLPSGPEGDAGKGFSLWLDVVRCSCALAVVEYHATNQHIAGFPMRRPPIGLDAVMVFFVLSGFVIAFVADTKERSFVDYAVTRLARLWSVLIPALILTIAADQIGMALSPALYENWGFSISPQSPVWCVIPSALFLNQLWFSPIAPLSNGPAWSIGFEFWYYAIFAFFAYFNGLWRICLAAIAMLIAGPRILLLAPVWFFGVACYYAIKNSKPLSPASGWLLFVLPLIPVAGLELSNKLNLFVSATASLISASWEYCDRYAWWYLAGILMALHFLGASSISIYLEVLLGKAARFIRFAAGMTLSIYLFHFPLLMLYSAAFKDWPPSYIRTITIFVLTVASAGLLGMVFERQKYPLRLWLKSRVLRMRAAEATSP